MYFILPKANKIDTYSKKNKITTILFYKITFVL